MATSTLQDAIGTIRAGDYETAQQQLAEVIATNPNEVQAWYLLSQIVDSDARRAAYLSKTLALDPFHQRAWAEFFSLPADVVNRLEPSQLPVAPVDEATSVGQAPASADAVEPPPPIVTAPAIAAATVAVAPAPTSIDVETALPDWLRPVAKDQPVVAQRRTTPAPVASPSTLTPPAAPEDDLPAPADGNRTLSVLLAILLIATLVVLAFLVYLLLQG